MAFSRDDLKQYEEKPATVVPDTTNPFVPVDGQPAKPVDQAPPDSGTAPSDTADVTPPDDSGDGTSDANDAPTDSSTVDAGSDSDSTTATTQEDGSTVPPKPKKGSAQERIQEVIEERESFKAYGVYAQDQIRARDARIAELEKQRQQPKPTTSATPAVPVIEDEPIPSFEDPDVQYDPEKLRLKQIAWRDRLKAKAQAAVEAAAKRPALNTPSDGEQAVAAFTTRLNEYAAANEGFTERVRFVPQMSAAAGKVMVLDKTGPAILDHLSRNIKDAVRIAGLSPEEQVLELGAIKAKLPTKPAGKTTVIPPTDTPAQGASQTPAKPKSTSNAPPPPTAVRGGSRHDQVPISDPSLSMDEFVRRDRAEKAARRSANMKARGLR